MVVFSKPAKDGDECGRSVVAIAQPCFQGWSVGVSKFALELLVVHLRDGIILLFEFELTLTDQELPERDQ